MDAGRVGVLRRSAQSRPSVAVTASLDTRKTATDAAHVYADLSKI